MQIGGLPKHGHFDSGRGGGGGGGFELAPRCPIAPLPPCHQPRQGDRADRPAALQPRQRLQHGQGTKVSRQRDAGSRLLCQ